MIVVLRWLKRAALILAAAAVLLLAVRAWQSQSGPSLAAWHTYVPDDLGAEEIDGLDWQAYLQAEERVFAAVDTSMTQALPAEDRVPINRYFDASPLNPRHLSHDWNRSFIFEPDAPPVGAVVLLHGLTDSPYSMRHIGDAYRDRGWLAVAVRLPGHGTVPGGLTGANWHDWMAATRLAVREARRRAGPSAPLHLVGYSNGGALALTYALDALDDSALPRPDKLVLVSPMVGVTAFARFVGLAAIPAVFPAFAKAAWISVVPEFNPFKYNSFPVKAGRQSYLLTDALREKIRRHLQNGQLTGMPPILSFQSAIDFTVSTRAIVDTLYANLPANGSELVLFDVNRNAKLGPLLQPAAEDLPARLLPEAPRRFRATVITNAGPDSSAMIERVVEAGSVTQTDHPLALAYPPDVYSLSHVALPFPVTDGLYGLQPDMSEDFGIRLGKVAARGERGALVVSLDWLLRLLSNPFFPYLIERVQDGLQTPGGPGPGITSEPRSAPGTDATARP